MLKRLFTLLAAVLAPAVAAAQTAPAQMGITPTTQPEVLQTLDNTKTWVPLGSVNSTTHTFSPVGGGGGGYGLNVTIPSIGMQAMTDATAATQPLFDNAPLVQTLMQAIAPTQPGNSGGPTVVFPWVTGANQVYYHFTQAFHLARGVIVDCGQASSGTNSNPGTTLVFDAGVDGVVQDDPNVSFDGGSAQGSDLRNCEILSLGEGVGNTANQTGNTFVTLNFMYYGSTFNNPYPWGAGDGILIVPRFNQYNPVPFGGDMTAVQPGAYLDSVADAGVTLNLHQDSGGATSFTAGVPSYDALAHAPLAFEIWRFPAAQGYNVTNEGPSTGAAAQSWTTGANTATATFSGTTANVTAVVGQICVGSVLVGGGLIPIGDLNNSTYLAPSVTVLPGGATSGCSSALGAYTISTTQTIASPVTVTVGAGIQVAPGTCNGVLQGAIVLDTTSANKKIGVVSLCDNVANVMALTTTVLTASSGATDALSFSSNVVFINGGSSRTWMSADRLWMDGFPYGAVTFRTSTDLKWPSSWGQAFSVWSVGNTAILPGAVSHAGGTGRAWMVPAGVKRQITSKSHSNTVEMFPTGLQMGCSSGQGVRGFNCTGSYDAENVYQLDLIGRLTEGDNSGGSTAHANSYYRNFMIDTAEMGDVGSFYSGEEYESYEGGYARLTALQQCVVGQNVSVYVGIYSTGSSNQCEVPATGGFVQPTNLGGFGPLWLGAQDFVPLDAFNISNGNFLGNRWTFYSQGSQTLTQLAGAANTNILTSSNAPRYAYDGVYVQDQTNPSAIPAGTFVTLVAGIGKIYLSQNLTANIPLSDTIVFGYAPALGYVHYQNAGPCFAISPGINNQFTNYMDRFCGGIGGHPWYMNYNGVFNAWNWSSAAGGGNGAVMTWLGSEYKGYNPNAGSMLFTTLELGGPGTNSAGGTERMLDSGIVAPTDAIATFTASDWFSTLNHTIGLTGGVCPVAFTTLSKSNTQILGAVASCSAATPTLTLTAAATAASLGSRDVLNVGAAAPVAQAQWATNSRKIPVNSCAGISAGQTVTDASNAGAAIGAVSGCVNETRVTLTQPAAFASTTGGDTLTDAARRQGDFRFNTGVVAGGTFGWGSTSNIATAMNPAGPVALDAQGAILTATLGATGAGGAGYAVNDTGVIAAGGRNATYVVDSVTAGAVATFHLSNFGSGYPVANNDPTVVSTGAGNGALTINVATISQGGNAWQYNAVVSGGTKPVGSGSCPINTQVGGMSTGSFKANGACAANGTIVLAMPNGVAPTGWRCGADDMTTPANPLKETAYTPSSVTFTALNGLAASDQVAFGPCTGF
jgi:hypothetical protein